MFSATDKKLIVILGPTATGKTRLGAILAHRFNGEIISADSRQVYRGMDIGTGKDLSDYKVEGAQVPFKMIDLIEPTEEFSLFDFLEKFIRYFNEISNRGKLPFLVGGTPLYIHAVLKKYPLTKVDFKKREKELMGKSLSELQEILLSAKPHLHNKTDLESKERAVRAIIIAESSDSGEPLHYPDFKFVVLGIKASKEEIAKRVRTRLEKRFSEGMIEEAQRLLDKGVSIERLKSFGLEYKFLAMYLNGEINYNDMFQKLNSAINKFAKRQKTWFRKMEREGIKINWIAPGDVGKAEEIIKHFLEKE